MIVSLSAKRLKLPQPFGQGYSQHTLFLLYFVITKLINTLPNRDIVQFKTKVHKHIWHQGIEASVRIPAKLARDLEDKEEVSVQIEKTKK